MSHKPLLSATYFGPVQYYCHLSHAETATIEQHDHYERQTYRNRACILGANGVITLSIPVLKPKEKVKTKDIRISTATEWQKLHWRSIVSAYNNSPFFEYYQDDIKPFYEKKWIFLYDLNHQALQLMVELLELPVSLTFSTDYFETNIADYCDLREKIHPKKSYKAIEKHFQPVSYRQVFTEKFGFIPNLSILDLLFNKGPESNLMLTQSLIINSI